MPIINLIINRFPVIFVLATLSSVLSGFGSMSVLLVLFRVESSSQQTSEKMIIFGFACFFAIASRMLAQRLTMKLTRDIIKILRKGFAEQILSKSIYELEQLGGLKVISMITTEIVRISDDVSNIISLLTNMSILLICYIYIGINSIIMLVSVSALMVAGVLLNLKLMRKSSFYMRLSSKNFNELRDAVHGLVFGVKELRLNVQKQADITDYYDAQIDIINKNSMRYTFYVAAADATTQSLFYLSLLLAILAVSTGSSHNITRYCVILVYMIGPITSVVRIYRGILESVAVIESARELGFRFDFVTSFYSRTTDGTLTKIFNDNIYLRLCNITYIYKNKVGIGEHLFGFGPVDIDMKSGEIIFITGGNGSGKTTLSKIITGLYEPDDGYIVLRDIRIDKYNLKWYMQHFSAIFQDYYLFDSFSNHALNRHYDRISTLVKRLDMENRVSNNFNSAAPLASLSFGERKRLALLVSLIEDRPIYIFDEWAADQDPHFRRIFYEEILPELRESGKLVIVITHDQRYFDIADKIISLERGQPPQYSAS